MTKKRILQVIIIFSILSGFYHLESYAQEGAHEGYVNFKPTTAKKQLKQKKLTIRLPYDEPVYILAYQVFLANNNPYSALQVAQKALETKPEDLNWHQRLAQAAMWSDQRKIAMTELTYIVGRSPSKLNIMNALYYANSIFYYADAIKIANPNLTKMIKDKNFVLSLAYSYQSMGDPDKAIQVLNYANQQKSEKEYYQQLIMLYESTTDYPGIRTAATTEMKKYGQDSRAALSLAQTYYKRNQLDKAEDVLIKAIPKAKADDIDYWDALGQISWILNKDKYTILAYKKLQAQHRLDSGTALSLVNLLLYYDPMDAAKQSFWFWETYKKPTSFNLLFDFLGAKEDLPLTSYVISNLTPEIQKQLINNYAFWDVTANYYLAINQANIAQKIMQKSILLHPDDKRYQLMYLDFLLYQIYNGDVLYTQSLLPITLLMWSDKANYDADWNGLFTFAYGVLNQPLNALLMDAPVIDKNVNNPDYLNRFASDLSIYGYDTLANNVRARGMDYFIKNPKSLYAGNPIMINNYISVSERYMNINNEYALLVWLTTQSDDTFKEALINWALANNDLPLAEWIAAHYTSNQPAWIKFKIALAQNDALTLERMMAESNSILPNDDTVTAANQINDAALAAYNSVQNIRSNTYKNNKNIPQMNNLIVTKTNTVNFNQAYQVFGNLAGWINEVSTTINDGNTTYEPYNSVWFTGTKDPTLLTNVPDQDESLGIKINHQYSRGYYLIDASIRDDTATFPTFDFMDNYNITSRLSGNIELGINQKATETESLWITGMKNLINLGASYNVDAYDNVSATYQNMWFNSQDNSTYVGNGRQFQAFANHKFWLNYPDYTLGAFWETDKFHDDGSITSSMAKVIPAAQQPATVASFIPQDFKQYGLDFNFGQNLHEYHTQAFRPYADVQLFYNNVSKRGDSFEAGLYGSLFGHDNISIYASQSENGGGVAQKNYKIGFKYKYFL